MKRALSRKNLWNALPRPLKACAGAMLGTVPLPWLLGPGFRRWRNLLVEAERWDAERIRAFQLEQLRELLTLARDKTRFYRECFREAGFEPGDLKDPGDLSGLPTIDKATILQHAEDMCTVPPNSPGVDYVSTGGTSGVPLRFYIGANRSGPEFAHLVTSWERAGYRLDMPMAVFRGRIVEPDASGLRHEYDPVLRHHYYSNFHMTDENMRRYVDHLAGLGPCVLHVYPSSAYALARFISRGGAPAPSNVRAVIAESEIVYPEQRALVEQVFGCRYFSCYGHTEKLVLAAECEHSTDDHVWPTYGYFELLDSDGRPVQTPGERGEIVGTGFINRVMPFIRYRTGDFATWVAPQCTACGRKHPVIRDIRGHRTQEMLLAADGAEISWTAMNMHDDTFENVRQFQFYQEEPGRAVLRIIPGPAFTDQDAARIHQNLGRKLEGRLAFTIQHTDSIPLSPMGKVVYVDRRIPAL